MNSLSDYQLLRSYAQHRSEAAFTELVRRHVDLVYSAAFRMVRDAHLAEDVTQGAFVALAQNASQLSGRLVLSGWLHRTAQNLASKSVRSEVRRRAREQEVVAMNDLHEPDTAWEHIAPQLEGALGELSEPDRDALPGRPQHLRFRHAIEKAQSGRMLDVAPALVTQPPRSIRVQPHFLSDTRKAAPSNFGAPALPTARVSASLRVIFGLRLLLTTNLGFPLAVTTSCWSSGRPSTKPALW